MKKYKFKIKLLCLCLVSISFSQKILIPMDQTQNDHLKSYGIAYYALKRNKLIAYYISDTFISIKTDPVKMVLIVNEKEYAKKYNDTCNKRETVQNK